MTTVQIAPGHWLSPTAAASYARMRAAGMPAGITSAGRTHAEQVAIFTARYRVQWIGRGPYGDVRWWQGRRYVRHSAAGPVAVPGSPYSRHETGNALDLPNTGARAWIRANGASHGWFATVPGEPWHYEHQAHRDQHVPSPTEYDMDTIDLRNADRVPVTGRHVDNLQGLLLAAGYGPKGLVGANGRPDGVAGAGTKAAAGDWQRRTNTGDGRGNPDFIFGARSWQTLIEF